MLTLFFTLMTVIIAPCTYKKLLFSSCVKLKSRKNFDQAVFSEVHRLFSGFIFDKTKVLLLVCVAATVMSHLLSFWLWDRRYSEFFNISDYMSLSGLILVWPVFGLAPWRFGYVLINKNKILVPRVFGSISYPRESTEIWIYQIGQQTFACCFLHSKNSSLIFVNRESVEIIKGWVVDI